MIPNPARPLRGRFGLVRAVDEKTEDVARRTAALAGAPRLAFLDEATTTEITSFAGYTAAAPGPLDFDVFADEILIWFGTQMRGDAAVASETIGGSMSYRLTRLSDNTIIQAASNNRAAHLLGQTAANSLLIEVSVAHVQRVTGLIPGRYRLQAYYRHVGGANALAHVFSRFITVFHMPRGDL